MAADLGQAGFGGDIAQAVRQADAVLLAVPYGAIDEVLAAAGDLDGKVLIDITNPITPDYMALTIGHTTSAAEEIERRAPGAIVIKAFNTLFAEVLTHARADHQPPLQVFYATDHQASGQRFAESVQALGFTPVHAGPLSNARYLEPLAELNIHLGYALGWGTLCAPAWTQYGK